MKALSCCGGAFPDPMMPHMHISSEVFKHALILVFTSPAQVFVIALPSMISRTLGFQSSGIPN